MKDNGAHSYTEGSEPIMTEAQRIIMDAVKYSRFNNNHDVVEGAEYRGYIAGATAELRRKDSEIQQLKEERNKAIDACINYIKESPIGLDAIDEEYIEAFESLKSDGKLID